MQNELRLTSAERLHFLSVLSELGQAERVLLSGFRDGLTALHLEKVASHLTVTDRDPDQLDNARTLFGGTEKFMFLDGSHDLNLPDRSIGLVVLADALPHGPKIHNVEELKRVLRNNGTLAVVTAEAEKPHASISALRSAFKYCRVWTSQLINASVMVEVEPMGHNAPFYKGYTSRHERAGLKIETGLLQASSKRFQFYLFSNEEGFCGTDPASIFCRPSQPNADTATIAIGVPDVTEPVVLTETASIHALAKALSQMTGSDVAPSGPEMMRALSTLANQQREQRDLATKYEDTLQQLEKNNRDARSEISRLRRQEMVIRSETDTAIAQKIAQTRRAKRLKTLALQSGNEIKTIVASRAEALADVERTARSTSTLLGTKIRQMALLQSSPPNMPGTNTASQWIGRISRLRTAALLAKGDTFNRNRDWQKAASCYAAALLREWHLPHIWVQFGHALKEQGMLEEAAAAYREASNADPTDTDALIHLGHLLLREGRRAAARATFCEALRRDSSNSEAATALKGLHETDETEKLLQLAYSIEQEAKTLD